MRSTWWVLGVSLYLSAGSVGAEAPGSVGAETPGSVGAQAPGTISVKVVGFESDAGHVQVALFNDPEGFPMSGQVAGLTASIADGVAAVTFDDVAPGEYAISVFHDANDNGELDTRFMGIPKEPIGASNDAKGRFGPPKFEDARFQVSEAPVELTINLQNL